MRFENCETAISQIIESSKAHYRATDIGDYKTANKNYRLINRAVEYLKAQNAIEKLKELLKHGEPSVKVWVASYLLRWYSDAEAVACLEHIAKQSIRHNSFDAEILLQEWRAGKYNK